MQLVSINLKLHRDINLAKLVTNEENKSNLLIQYSFIKIQSKFHPHLIIQVHVILYCPLLTNHLYSSSLAATGSCLVK